MQTSLAAVVARTLNGGLTVATASERFDCARVSGYRSPGLGDLVTILAAADGLPIVLDRAVDLSLEI